jgi:hypothetical protein
VKGGAALVLVILLAAAPASAQLDQWLKGLGMGSSSGLSDAKIGAGLKEAPEKLRRLESGLRVVGYGPEIDEFVLSMNRAAEQAAPQAKQIFLDAVGEMTFDDARKILNGSDTAATEYFKGKTTDNLTAAFKPVVEKSMNEVGVTRQYRELVGRFESIPFARSEAFDVDRYVIGKSLDGLFHVLGEREKQIRTNPTARVTDLLKEVFRK